MAVGSVAVMPGALNRFVFIKVALMACGSAIAFSAPRRGRLPSRVIAILCVGTVILLVASIREPAPLYALVGRAPRFEGIFVLPVYLGAAVAGACLLGPGRAPGSTSWFLQWLALAAVLVGIEGALELAGQRPLAISGSRRDDAEVALCHRSDRGQRGADRERLARRASRGGRRSRRGVRT
jgi:hypothetical protein